MSLDKPATRPGFFGWPIKAQARRPLHRQELSREHPQPSQTQHHYHGGRRNRRDPVDPELLRHRPARRLVITSWRKIKEARAEDCLLSVNSTIPLNK
jgi:hypothetical protein